MRKQHVGATGRFEKGSDLVGGAGWEGARTVDPAEHAGHLLQVAVIEEPDARVVLVLLEGHWCGAGAGDRGVSAPVSLVLFPRVRAFPDLGDACPPGSSTRPSGWHDSRVRRHQTLTRERAGHIEPPLAVLAKQHANHAFVLGVVLERAGKGGGRFSHRTGEGTRFRSARRGGARTSSTRRKWSTTERSTRGCTTTSSYCPRGLTTSTLAAIVGGRVPITCGERLRRPRRFDREEKSWKRPRPRKCRRRLRARDSAKRGAHTRGASNDIT